MRTGQQNKYNHRVRNNNQNRKGQNPLSRTYESNGPDVKVRGNAQQVAEKYIALARDALSSGDRIMAENYLQHAEHYNRLIFAAQQANLVANNNAEANQPAPTPVATEITTETTEENCEEKQVKVEEDVESTKKPIKKVKRLRRTTTKTAKKNVEETENVENSSNDSLDDNPPAASEAC
ncbi:DUF4167 domain-containing protein [Bartonella sp. DGB1]|uniref:DUF4167 domain-containing protein n=1 Tax=Bartonella sp. DGB1 TaxID=3239807 RepID=UPI00352435E7